METQGIWVAVEWRCGNDEPVDVDPRHLQRRVVFATWTDSVRAQHLRMVKPNLGVRKT